MSEEPNLPATTPPVNPPTPAPEGPGAQPSAPKVPDAAKATRGARVRVQPPPVKGSKLKKHLMLWIVILTVVLSGLIVYRLIAINRRPPPVDAREVIKDAYESARGARDKIEEIEKRIGTKGEELKQEDLDAIGKELRVLEASHDKLKEMMDLLEKKNAQDSQEMSDSYRAWMWVKLWILDANGVRPLAANDPTILEEHDPEAKGDDKKFPPGLYIPMYTADRVLKQCQEELANIKAEADKILQSGDAKKKAETEQKLKKLLDNAFLCNKKYAELHKYITDGLVRDDLTDREIKELGDLEASQQIAGTTIQEIRTARLPFMERK